MVEPVPERKLTPWQEAVVAADAEAEKAWVVLRYRQTSTVPALRAIAAELRAQRIAARPSSIGEEEGRSSA